MLEGRVIQPDPNAILKQRTDVSARRPVHEPVIAGLRDDDVHGDAACGGEREGGREHVTRQELGGDEPDAALSGVEGMQHDMFDLLDVGIRPGGYDPRHHRARRCRPRDPAIALKVLARGNLQLLTTLRQAARRLGLRPEKCVSAERVFADADLLDFRPRC